MASVTVERALLKDVVRDRLRDAILDGTFLPGEILRDAELVEWLEVSRTPLREAINDLARIGLIETYPNRYTRVARRIGSNAAPSLQALAVLHGGAVLLAVPTLSETAIARLQRRCDELIECIWGRDEIAIRDGFLSLFRAVDAAGENEAYRRWALSDLDAFYFQTPIEMVVRTLDARRLDEVAEATEELKVALAVRDAQRARLAAETMHTAMI
nr:GntR family transcriptional regulator [Leifsonia naganoensis]